MTDDARWPRFNADDAQAADRPPQPPPADWEPWPRFGPPAGGRPSEAPGPAEQGASGVRSEARSEERTGRRSEAVPVRRFRGGAGGEQRALVPVALTPEVTLGQVLRGARRALPGVVAAGVVAIAALRWLRSR